MKPADEFKAEVATGARLDELAKICGVSPRTIAQSIRICCDPYRAAITSFIRREIIRSDDGQSDKKIFHFEDGSFLTFMVSYAPIDDGSM